MVTKITLAISLVCSAPIAMCANWSEVCQYNEEKVVKGATYRVDVLLKRNDADEGVGRRYRLSVNGHYVFGHEWHLVGHVKVYPVNSTEGDMTSGTRALYKKLHTELIRDPLLPAAPDPALRKKAFKIANVWAGLIKDRITKGHPAAFLEAEEEDEVVLDGVAEAYPGENAEIAQEIKELSRRRRSVADRQMVWPFEPMMKLPR